MTKFIDSPVLISMVQSGAYNLNNNKELVDALNVFPVPDGDTGTNMSLTFLSAAKAISAGKFDSTDIIANTVAKATLRGARGNSGVILSQIFRGISKSITTAKIDVPSMKSALRCGSDTAYRAVMKPTEGTILTVIRAAAESAEAYEGDDIKELFNQVLAGMQEALTKTQDMLPQLKQAGVVDAGGQGLVCIFEGFVKALNGEPVEIIDKAAAEAAKTPAASQSTEKIKYAYCTEFIINKRSPVLTAEKMRSAIEPKGDCMIVIDEEDIVKVHIHTNHPGFVLEQAVKLGEMVNIKIENMREQHSDMLSVEPEKKATPHKEVAVVSVATGEGLIKTFTELGVTNIVPGGQTMNPSTEDILSCIEEANADTVFVLPNNKNIILAAQQAAKIAECNVIVIESKTIPQGISAMMAYSATENVETNTKKMTKALGKVTSGNVTYAVKNTEMDGLEIHEGDYIGVSEGHIISDDKELSVATLELVSEIADEDSEFVTVYYGEDVSDDDAKALAASIEGALDDVEVTVVNGGQSVYYYIISIE